MLIPLNIKFKKNTLTIFSLAQRSQQILHLSVTAAGLLSVFILLSLQIEAGDRMDTRGWKAMQTPCLGKGIINVQLEVQSVLMAVCFSLFVLLRESGLFKALGEVE